MVLHGELKYRMEGPEEGYVPATPAGKEKNSFFKSRCKNALFNFKSIFITLKGHDPSDSGTAGGEWIFF